MAQTREQQIISMQNDVAVGHRIAMRNREHANSEIPPAFDRDEWLAGEIEYQESQARVSQTVRHMMGFDGWTEADRENYEHFYAFG
jgi:hypothetical protein